MDKSPRVSPEIKKTEFTYSVQYLVKFRELFKIESPRFSEAQYRGLSSENINIIKREKPVSSVLLQTKCTSSSILLVIVLTSLPEEK